MNVEEATIVIPDKRYFKTLQDLEVYSTNDDFEIELISSGFIVVAYHPYN